MRNIRLRFNEIHYNNRCRVINIIKKFQIYKNKI